MSEILEVSSNRIVNRFAIWSKIANLLIERPNEYINKPFVCKEFGWGCVEWQVAYDYLYLIVKTSNEFFKDAYEASKLMQGSPEENYKKFVEIFIQKYKVPPVRYSGSNIVGNDGTVYPPSYVVLTYNEYVNRLNILGLKGTRDLNTKLHNIVDKGYKVLFAEDQKELIGGVVRMLVGDAYKSENADKLLNSNSE